MCGRMFEPTKSETSNTYQNDDETPEFRSDMSETEANCSNDESISSAPNSHSSELSVPETRRSNKSEICNNDSQIDNSYSTSSDIDMRSDSTNPTTNTSRTIRPYNFSERIYTRKNTFNTESNNASIDAQALIDRLRDLLSDSLNTIELGIDEMQHIIKVLRRNDVID